MYLEMHNRFRFNNLPEIEIADAQRKFDGSLDRVIELLAPIFQKFSMAEHWGVALLHKHWDTINDEWPVQHIVMHDGHHAFETKPRDYSQARVAWPSILAASNTPHQIAFDVLEFSSDPITEAAAKMLEAAPDFQKACAQALISAGLENTYGICVLKSYPTEDLELVEFNYVERVSLLQSIKKGSLKNTSLMETSWHLIPLSAAAKCRSRCVTQCANVNNRGHSPTHFPAHDS
jgi:hypothetical protein